MKKIDLIRLVAEKTEGTIKETKVIVDAVFDVITERLVAGEDINIKGFGKYHTIVTAPQVKRSPSTGEIINVPEKRRPKLKFAQHMTDILNEQ